MLIVVYVISSWLCVLAGLVMMARFNSARMGYGDAYLLLTVLAIILGGADPNGGFGRVTGVVLALLALQILSTGFSLLNISQHFSLAMWGVVLILVLAIKRAKGRLQHFLALRRRQPRASLPHLTEKGSVMRIQISPSLMCMNLMEIKQQLSVLNSRADFLHVDIMDGHYVKTLRCRPFYRTDTPAHAGGDRRASDGGKSHRLYSGGSAGGRRFYLPACGDHQPRRLPGDQPDPRAG